MRTPWTERFGKKNGLSRAKILRRDQPSSSDDSGNSSSPNNPSTQTEESSNRGNNQVPFTPEPSQVARLTRLGYVVAVVGTALAALLRWELGRMIGEEIPPYMTFYPVIMASAVFAGRTAGMLATMISVGAVAYLFLPPAGFAVEKPGDLAALVLFILINIFISIGGGALRKAHLRARRQMSELIEKEKIRKQAEDQLRASLREINDLKTALDEHAIVAITDPKGRITYANDKFCVVSKYSREELLGQDHRILNSGFHSQQFFRELWETIQSGRVWHGQIKNRAKDGSFYWVDSTIVPFLNEQGKPRQYVAIRTDVTETKQKEQEISEKARLLDLSMDAIIVRDLTGRIQYWNRGAEKLYGWTSEEALGKDLYSLLQREDPEPLEQITAKLCQTNHWAGELVDKKREGQRVSVLARKALDRDQAGNPATVMESITDISERKKTEESLRHAQEKLNDRAAHLESLVTERTSKLKETNQQLEAFVYSIAHDLRAPLRAMEGFSAALVKEAASLLSERSKDYAARINSSAQFMDAMLKDLLAISQISQQEIELTAVSLKPIVEGVIDWMQTDIQEKGAQVEIEGEWPAVMAHHPTLIQVLSNLLGNALKFVNPGVPPRVRMRAEEGAGFIRVWVEDNGIGIAPDHQRQIFGLFNRLGGDKHSGTGVGLAIVQKGTERMGGTVGVESELGKGSRFWFELKKAL